MDFRPTYLDYALLIGDRRPPRHQPTAPVRRPKGIRRWLP
jgi:hypothetical protein